jgi:hypothetical protein
MGSYLSDRIHGLRHDGRRVCGSASVSIRKIGQLLFQQWRGSHVGRCARRRVRLPRPLLKQLVVHRWEAHLPSRFTLLTAYPSAVRLRRWLATRRAHWLAIRRVYNALGLIRSTVSGYTNRFSLLVIVQERKDKVKFAPPPSWLVSNISWRSTTLSRPFGSADLS